MGITREIRNRVSSLVAQRRPGYTMPQPFYGDAEIFAVDMERIFRRYWVPAGPASRIPEKGQWYLFDIGQDSIIIARNYDGEVHAMHNVCRHRGSRVCYQQEGFDKGLVCPYHAWVYALDGTLLGAGAMPCDFDKSQFGLKRVAVTVIHGMVMVFLGDGPSPDISDVARDLGTVLSISQLGGAKLAARMTWEIHANWKLVVENFDECYHCGPAHPEYCSVMDIARSGTTGTAAHREAFERQACEWRERARLLGHPVGNVQPSDGRLHSYGRIPIGSGRLSQSRDGKPIAPLMGGFKENDGGITSAEIYPGAYWINACDHAVTFRFTPTGPKETLQEIAWLVHPDAVEGSDYDLNELTWLWKVTTDQDKLIIDQNQKGVNSSAYEPGPYAKVEDSVTHFVNWYLQQLL